MTSARQRLRRQLERGARARGGLVEEVQHAPAAQRGHLLDLALGDLGERLRPVEDALDRRRGRGPRSTAGASRECLLELGDRHLVDAVDLGDADVDALASARSAGSCRRSRGGSAARGGRGRPARRAGRAPGARSRTAPRSPPATVRPGVEHVVDEDDGVVLEPEAQVGRVDGRVGRRAATGRRGRRRCRCRRAGRSLLQQVAHEPVQARGEVRAAAVDAHEGDGLGRSSSPRSRARCARACGGCRPRRGRPWVRACGSFLASRDRVRDGVTVAVGPGGTARARRRPPRGASSRSAVRRAVSRAQAVVVT